MKHRKQPFRLVLILAVLTALGAGCGKPENAPSASNAAPAKTEKPPEMAKTKEAEQETAEAGKPVTGREITDMAGRTVILPASVETIFPTH